MIAPRRLAKAHAAVTASIALASCTAAGPAHPASATSERTAVTASFSAMGLSLRYPATWRPGTWSDNVSSAAASAHLPSGCRSLSGERPDAVS